MKYIILFWLLSNFVFSQSQFENDSILVWNKNRKICWEDFMVDNELDFENNFHAAVSTNIIIFPKAVRKFGDFKFIAVLYKKKSWAAFKSDILLEHEQLHFNITELFARKLRKFFSDEKNYFLTNPIECQAVYNSIMNELILFQNLYDEETKFGTFESKQKEWNLKVYDLLEMYKEYELEIEIDGIY